MWLSVAVGVSRGGRGAGLGAEGTDQAAKPELALGACCKVTAMSPARTGAVERTESKEKFPAALE